MKRKRGVKSAPGQTRSSGPAGVQPLIRGVGSGPPEPPAILKPGAGPPDPALELEPLIGQLHLPAGDLTVDLGRARLLSGVLAVGLGVAFLRFTSVMVPFLIAAVLAVLFEPLVSAVERRIEALTGPRAARLLAVTAFFAVGATLIVALGLPLMLALVSHALRLADQVSRPDLASYKSAALDLVDRYRAWASNLPMAGDLESMVRAHQDQIVAATGKLLESLGQQSGAVVRRFSIALLSGGAQALNLVLVPVVLFYLLFDYRAVGRGLFDLVPRSHQSWALRVFLRVEQVLGGFVRGQLTIAAIASVIFTVGLKALGVPYAFVIGPAAGLATFVPYMSGFVLVPAGGILLFQWGFSVDGLLRLMLLALLYGGYQTLEGAILGPQLVASAVELHPLLVLLALPIAGDIGGLEGLVLAVPGAAVLKVLFEESRAVIYGSEITHRSGESSR